MSASIGTGGENVAVCQPLALSPVNVPYRSFVPSAVQRLALWPPVFDADL